MRYVAVAKAAVCVCVRRSASHCAVDGRLSLRAALVLVRTLLVWLKAILRTSAVLLAFTCVQVTPLLLYPGFLFHFRVYPFFMFLI